ncbi:hypothetical protein Unana1_03188 [Umbelopsis nana]
MPSVTELISSIKANSSSNSFLTQPKKRKSDSSASLTKKKSRTISEKKEKSGDALLNKLKQFGEQFMQSVDDSSSKLQKRSKKKAATVAVAPVEPEPVENFDEDDEEEDEKDEIDQLFGSANASIEKEDDEELANERKTAKGPEVVVFADTPKKIVTGTSKAEYKAFMSSKVSKMEAPPLPPPKSAKELEEEEENLAHDRELKELLATSKLLEEYEMEEMTGKERRKYNMNKLETLGVKKSKPQKMPIQMRLGMDKKQKERDQKTLQEAKDIGIYDKSLKHLYAAASKPKEQKKRDRGIGSSIGKMKGSTLVLSKTEIKRVERQGMKPKAGKRKQGGGNGRGGKSGGRGQSPSTPRKVRILVGATGSVASIKIPKLVHLLRQNPHYEIKVVTTKPALHFFNSSEVGAEVITDEDEWNAWRQIKDPVLHIELRNWADIMVLAPLDANTLAKVANGLCDNLLTCVLRAWDSARPVLACPAMNTNMWMHPFTAKHLETLETLLSYKIISPISKLLACGDLGVGAMAEVETIVEEVIQTINSGVQAKLDDADLQ